MIQKLKDGRYRDSKTGLVLKDANFSVPVIISRLDKIQKNAERIMNKYKTEMGSIFFSTSLVPSSTNKAKQELENGDIKTATDRISIMTHAVLVDVSMVDRLILKGSLHSQDLLYDLKRLAGDLVDVAKTIQRH